MHYAVINGKKYQVIIGDRFTTFKLVGSIIIRTVKNSTRVSELPKLLK